MSNYKRETIIRQDLNLTIVVELTALGSEVTIVNLKSGEVKKVWLPNPKEGE